MSTLRFRAKVDDPGETAWPSWPRADALGLARYVSPETDKWLRLDENPADLARDAEGRGQLIRAIYDALTSVRVRYSPEKYLTEGPYQLVRTPGEILDAPRQRTCLDLAILFCGACLSYELIPVVILIEGDALAAVALNHGRREAMAYGRAERAHFEREGFLRGEEAAALLRGLVARGDYLAVECTGFAVASVMPADTPEGFGRAGGLLDFDRAVAAGREQLDRDDRPLRFATDVAIAQDKHGIQPYSVGRPTASSSRRTRGPAGRVDTLDDRGPSTTERVLREQIGRLESKEQIHVDEQGKLLWRGIQKCLEIRDVEAAAKKGTRLRQWIEDGGRKASRPVRGRAFILLADLAAIRASLADDPSAADLTEARGLEARARDEFGANVSRKDVARLATLAAKLDFLDGRRGEGLDRLTGCDDPSCVSLRLAILIGDDKPAEAVDSIGELPLHEKWCDKAVLARLMASDPDGAAAVIAWARKRANVGCYHRCLLASVRGKAYRIFGGWDAAARARPGVFPDGARAELEAILDDLKPLLLQAEAKGRATTGLEIEAVDIAASTCYLLCDPEGRNKFASLLGGTEPVPIRFGNLVMRGDVPPPMDLPRRLRSDHPRSFEANLLAALIEGEYLGRGGRAFQAGLGCRRLAASPRQKEFLCEMLFELSAFAGRPGADSEVLGLARELLGEDHRLVGLIEAGMAIEAGRDAEADPLLSRLGENDDPLWWQLSAKRKLKSGDDPGALADLIRASEILPRPALLDGVAGLATRLGRFDLARETLVRLLTFEPSDLRSRQNLALACVRLQRFDEAAAEFDILARAIPDDPAYSVNRAAALAQGGRAEEALVAFDGACKAHPLMLPAVAGKANLLHILGRPDEAFQALHGVRDRYWSEPSYLSLYLSLAFGAGREFEAGMALRRLAEIQEAGKGDTSQFQILKVEELQDLFRERLERRREIDEALIAGRLPWPCAGSAMGRTAYSDWWDRTHAPDAEVPAHPVGRAEFAVYATNGATPLPDLGGESRLQPITCPPAGRPIVADLTALIAAHQLGLIGDLVEHFGRVLLPADYPALLRSEQGALRPRQPTRLEAIRAICSAAIEGCIILWDRGASSAPKPPRLDEHGEAAESGTAPYRLLDIGRWLRRTGRIGEREFERLVAFGQPARMEIELISPEIAEGGLLASPETLVTVATLECLRPLIAGAKVYVESGSLRQLRGELARAERDESLVRACGELCEALLNDARFERIGLAPIARLDGGDFETDQGWVASIAAFLLAEQEGLPLLVDDRACQAWMLNRVPRRAEAAFGTDALLSAFNRSGRLTPDRAAGHLLQLMRWRYRFVVPPAEALIELAVGFIDGLPGAPLRDVSRYVHDCMRESGLFGGIEATTPPTSMATDLFQRWTGLVGKFVALAWVDDRFDDEAATKLTEWAVREFLPSPPRNVPPIAQVILCDVTPRLVLIGALMSTQALRKPERTNRALRAIARGFGLSDAQYMNVASDMVAHACDFGLDADPRRLDFLRHLAATTLGHLDEVDQRTFVVLDRLGIVGDAGDALSASDYAPLLDPDHPHHIRSVGGPLALLSGPGGEDDRFAVSVPSLIVSHDAGVRAIGLEYFERMARQEETPLSPRSRSSLAEYGPLVREDAFDRWHPAACLIDEILDQDFLLNLAGFREELIHAIRGEGESYFRKVLKPGMWLYASISPEAYGTNPSADLGDPLLSGFVEGAETLTEALVRFDDRFGHLPAGPPRSLGTLLRLWTERRGESGVWDLVWAWADAPADPLRRYHACRAFAEEPRFIPEDRHGRLWDEVARVLLACKIGGDIAPEDESLKAVCDLARHYLDQLEMHAPVPETSRLVELAWWAARRVIATLHRPGVPSGATDRWIGELRKSRIRPEAELSRAVRRMVLPVVPSSVPRFATAHHGCLWSHSLLTALGSAMERLRPELASEAALEGIITALIVNLHQPCPLLGRCPTEQTWGLGTSLLGVAKSLMTLLPEPEAAATIEALATEVERLRDPRAIIDRLRDFPSIEPDQRWLCGSAFLAASHADDFPAEEVWGLISGGDWFFRNVQELPIPVLDDIIEGLSALRARAGSDWEYALPHLFAGAAELPDLAGDRRSHMVVATIVASANSGTVGAVRRLAEGERRAIFRTDLLEIRDRLEQAAPSVPPWAAARFRDVLACLPSP